MRRSIFAGFFWQWLAVGLPLLSLPAVREGSFWLGSAWFWLVAAPLSSLVVVHWQAVTAVWRTTLFQAPRRRRFTHRALQARPCRGRVSASGLSGGLGDGVAVVSAYRRT